MDTVDRRPGGATDDGSDGPASGWSETPSLEALREMVSAAARMRHVVARRAGLTDTELTTLDHLSREPLGPAEVARRLDVSTAASTGIVDRLAARGHVERRPHPADRRRTEVHITPSGRAEVVAHLLPMFRTLDELDRSFTAEERAVVERYLAGATEAFERVIAGG